MPDAAEGLSWSQNGVEVFVRGLRGLASDG
jgi:hypothetical protein